MANDDPLYRRVSATKRLFRSEADAEAGLPGFWSGWLAGAADANDPIALSAAWPDASGCLVFLPKAPAAPATFEQDLIDYIASFPAGFKPRLLWLFNPELPRASWKSADLSVTGTGVDTKTAKTQSFLFEDYSLRIGAGTPITLDTPAGGIAAFLFGKGIEFLAPQARATPSTPRLPMAGADFGVHCGEIALAGTGSNDTLQALGAMLRYARLQPNGVVTESVDLPLLKQDGTALDLAAALDPLAPLFAPRTRLRFLPAAQGTTGTLTSAWLTTLGRGVNLTPATSPPPGLDPAQLVFAATPRNLSAPNLGSKYHLAPSGAFAMTIEPAPNRSVADTADPDRLMLGLAGTEYLALPPGQSVFAVFIAGQPALLKPGGDPVKGPMDGAATTAYASFVVDSTGSADAAGAIGIEWFAQPQSAPLYAAGSSATVLDFKAVLAGRLPPLTAALTGSGLTALPVGAFIGVDPRMLERARSIEIAGLAPKRRAQMGVPVQSDFTADAAVRAVTPPGLVADVNADSYQSVVVANLPASQTPEVRFTSVSPAFQAALQSNQLFFVVADPAALGTQTALDVELSGWRFKLGPANWRLDPDTRTYLLFKFAGRSLEALAADPSTWGWQEAGKTPGGTLADTSQGLARIFAAAKAAPAGSPYRRFYDDVVASTVWSGVLFLNAAIDVGQLDPQLGFITAGVVLDRFYAHHVGFSLTPYQLKDQAIELGQTAAFALVDYQDRRDLTTTKTIAFDYKTLALTAQFANAALTGFSAEVELLANRLFGTELTKLQPERGNNLVLAGSFHTVDGAPAYAFELVGKNVYATASGALASIEVASVALQTESVNAAAGTQVTRFTASGNLALTENLDFDLFGYGPAFDGTGEGHLRFGNLAVRMYSRRDGSGDKTFAAQESALSFDLANSEARPQSLIAKFPLTLTSFIAVAPADKAPTPDKLGYVSIAAPIDQTVLAAPWYGFSYTLQLGTLGALAGSAGLTIQLLTAWMPASDDAEAGIYLGLKFPGLSDLGIQLPLQGVLSLGFRSFEMQRYLVSTGIYGYLLRLRRLALSFLGFSVPPGNTDVVLFGNPQTGAEGPLGWYAAYAKDLPPKKPPTGTALIADETAASQLADTLRARTTNALRTGPRSEVLRLRRRRSGQHSL